ncbi:hypothetical protein HWQ46_21375 [Shewanella sp. D64]|uniref:hypothetical protein n=1 Tax=unclassified Shewanella TaxID=196818 RepID=UPI0022BA5DC1|nr:MULTISPECIES: hypothetical protein [unclassified Shewanella]MEC4728091.1 hypothetical protein [Shewanella sp. D64]MEC4738151.1 hypothetical protein [Shewanella sp. E94]WBJ96337.1 hypothetical protein HWQ47_04215 [Shewanella sp. MTB7]
MKILLLILLALFSAQAYASDWPEIEFPESAKVEVVADNMRYQGYPMKTWVVTDKQNQMMMANFFKQQWQDNSERFDARMFNGDYVINSMQPPYLLTARISQNFDGVVTYVGITKEISETELAKVNQHQFPKPHGATVISDIQSQDLFKHGRTLVLSSPQSLSASYHYYRRHFQQRGWLENAAILDTNAGKAVLQISQGTNLIDISFNIKKSKVYIVANQVTEGL